MKQSTLASATTLGLVLVAAAAVLIGEGASGADHADSPDTSEGNLDVNDLYVFNNGDNVVFALTVSPLLTPGAATNDAYFNPQGLYQIKLDVERDGVEDAVIQVTARGMGADQIIDVRGPVPPDGIGTTQNTLVDATSARGGLESTFTGNGMTVFAGTRDDPFFIDLFGDMSVTSVLNAVYSSALGEPVGSPDEQTLAFDPGATDDLAGLNVLAIVIEMPKSQVADALGISTTDSFFAWATTSIRN